MNDRWVIRGRKCIDPIPGSTPHALDYAPRHNDSLTHLFSEQFSGPSYALHNRCGTSSEERVKSRAAVAMTMPVGHRTRVLARPSTPHLPQPYDKYSRVQNSKSHLFPRPSSAATSSLFELSSVLLPLLPRRWFLTKNTFGGGEMLIIRPCVRHTMTSSSQKDRISPNPPAGL